MLQSLKKFLSPTKRNMSNLHPKISISISTSSPTLSKSGNQPFTITLSANFTNNPQTITIDTFHTVLYHRSLALDYQGLTFKDTSSGELAKRRVIDVQYRVPESLTETLDSVAEIPPLNDGSEAYIVRHTFQTPASSEIPGHGEGEQPCSTDPEMDAIAKDLMREMTDQTAGLEVGRTYEIGLGNDMNRVSWWRVGMKAEVFAQGSVSRRPEGPTIEMNLVKTATFTVVE
ncbi:hypothetical protein CB0940_11073 [Cercospora beticola]|uniref:Uncharacterized protein n=2 Tax=Cercospora beticola TaxID=122368 RepID=A0A2G5HEF1_CERBT|nr:hypothetical protein CB0940_11073 [Cercospora beticola]PIA90934.1 hypothetical protein CB0940_11073 [Cercospora beticola]